jgi:hypothetical protein
MRLARKLCVVYRYFAIINCSLLLLLLLVSCQDNSHFNNIPPPPLDMGIFEDTDNGYSIQYPKEWKCIDEDLQFTTLILNESSTQMISGVHVLLINLNRVGSRASVQDYFNNVIPVIEKQNGKGKSVIFKGHDAFECIYTSKDGHYLYGVRFVVRTDKCVWDIHGSFANSDDFKIGEYIISTLDIK